MSSTLLPRYIWKNFDFSKLSNIPRSLKFKLLLFIILKRKSIISLNENPFTMKSQNEENNYYFTGSRGVATVMLEQNHICTTEI